LLKHRFDGLQVSNIEKLLLLFEKSQINLNKDKAKSAVKLVSMVLVVVGSDKSLPKPKMPSRL